MKPKKPITKKEIKEYILNHASEQDMIEIVELMRARKSILDLEKIAIEKEKIINKVKDL